MREQLEQVRLFIERGYYMVKNIKVIVRALANRSPLLLFSDSGLSRLD